MNKALHHLQSTLQSEGAQPPPGDALLSRLALAIRGGPEITGPADLAILTRQAALCAEISTDQPREIFVPRTPLWPDEALWRRHSCEVQSVRPGWLRVRPRAWQPRWLDPGAERSINAAIQREPRRTPHLVPADPSVVTLLDQHSYLSPGQRAAVQAAFLTPAGSTSIISLPTGGGKSLTFQLPALTWQGEGGVTLVITPTTALARDQASRFCELLEKNTGRDHVHAAPLAYHGGLDDESRRKIANAIRAGEAPIVFTSPEAAVGALRNPLFEAAKQGRLRVFAIDEAHLVAQWGEQFRPQFQMLAGFRDTLLDACPPHSRFRTLLLTATLTSEAHETLRFLFSQGGSQLICELALRPEISFLLHEAPDEPTRIAHVLEAIDHLPRPLILYTTLREHAESWYERLRERGYKRLRLVRGGDLADEEGERILQDWRQRSIDVVVATAAFGVGMDQSEIRTVVHACLPETIDRYYQEVGRAGRDGNAAVALLATAPDDRNVAHDLAEKTRISVERGFERWQYLWSRRRREANNTYVLRLDVSPPDITASSLRNESWNLRTLVLMARAGLITFASHALPTLQPDPNELLVEFEERRREALQRFSLEVAVRIRDDRHADETHWNTIVASLRAHLYAQDARATRLVDELHHLQRPLNELFAEVYNLSSPHARPSRLLGDCPVTRARGIVSFNAPSPEVVPLSRTDITESSDLARHLTSCTDEAMRSWISYVPPLGSGLELRSWRRRVVTLLRQVVARGVVELCLPDELCTSNDWAQLIAESSSRFLVRGSLDEDHTASHLPRLTLLNAEQVRSQVVDATTRLNRPSHIIIMPRHAPNPSRPPGELLFDRIHHLTLETLMMRLGQ